MVSTSGTEHADEWRYEDPCGDPVGAIATEGRGWRRGDRAHHMAPTAEMARDRPKHRSAAFMSEPRV